MSSGGSDNRSMPSVESLPENPQVSRGVRLLYLGAAARWIRGPVSGYVYHVSGARRTVVVHQDDAEGLLAKDTELILEP
jgi:hypothetical protein